MSERQEKTARQRAWEATPDLVVAAVENQATEFYTKGRLERSQELFEKLVVMRPQVAHYHSMLGIVHRRQGRLVKGLQSLQRAAELDPDDRNALVNLGESLVIAGKVLEGADVLRAVFQMGYERGKPPSEQDQFTKRAGAQLAILEQIARGVKEGRITSD